MRDKIAYRVIKSSRKTMAMEITKQGEVLIRAPYQMPDAEIERFVRQQADWIRKNLEKMSVREEKLKDVVPMSREEIERLADEALVDLPKRVERYAPLVGVTYGSITIRNQKTRWGSCSAKGNLNFNLLLMRCPESVRDYVVIHELCHRLEMNHSPRFWAEVERLCPDWRKEKKYLDEHGAELMESMLAAYRN